MMKMYPTLGLALTLLGCSALGPQAQVSQAEEMPVVEAPVEAEQVGLDASLTTFPYPFEVKTHKVRVQGQSLQMAYMDVLPEGEAKGVVLLLHGKNFSGAYWADTITALRAAGYRVVAPDQLGFGRSSKPIDIQYSFHLFGALTRELIASLGVSEVHVVGHSMGGMVASRFTLMFPDVAQSLTLVNPIGLEDWKRHVPYLTVDEWTQRELAKTPEGVQAYMTKSYFDGQWTDAYEPLVALQAGWVGGPDWPHLAKVSALTYDMIFTQPVLYEFPLIKAPTLLVIGQRDRTALGKGAVSPEVAATLGRYPELGRLTATAIPQATLVELDAIGHIPQFEAKEAWLESLLGFLGDVDE